SAGLPERGPRWQPTTNKALNATISMGKREHIKRPSCRCVFRKIRCGTYHAEGGRAVTGIDGSGHHRTRPSADPREHGDILMPVRSAVADGLTDDSAVDLVTPQQISGARVHRLEPSIHGAVKNDVARGYHGP